MKKRTKPHHGEDFSVLSTDGQPDTAEEMTMKYGTYNIQPTAESDNQYPQIAQGLPKHGKNGRKSFKM